MNRLAARLAVSCALVGLGASLAAAYAHYRVLIDPSYSSFCDVSLVVSCTQVYESRFGTLGGVSVALFGVIWFGVATLLSVAGLAGPSSVRESAPGYLFVWSTMALAVVLYLGYASFVVLKLVCVLCLTTYAAVVGLFLISGASPVRLRALPSRIAGDLRLLASRPAAGALAVLLVAGPLVLLAVFPKARAVSAESTAGDAAGTEREQFERWYAAQPRISLDVPAAGAAVVVVKFNDYQCPPCRQTFMDYQPVFARYDAERPGAVRLVIKDFPLESECNAGVTKDLHPAGCESAVAVRLARELGKAEPLEQWIFANQGALTPQLVEQGAREVAGITNFRERYEATLQAVKIDTGYGQKLGVSATPTFFINGAKIQGGLPSHLFDHAIAYELQRAALP